MFKRRCNEDSYWKKKEIQRNGGLLEKGCMAESTPLISINKKIFTWLLCDGPVAQWIRHLTTNQGIPGSSPGRVAPFHFPSIFSFFSLSFFPLLKYSLFSIPNKGRKAIINSEIGRTSVIIPIFPTNQRNKLWIDRLTRAKCFPSSVFTEISSPLTNIGPTLEKIYACK